MIEDAAHQIEELTLAVQDLQRRVEALERGTEAGRPQVEPSKDLSPPAVEVGPGQVPSGLLVGFGRMLLGIAGAYLLRAITEANVLPQLAGTLIGVLYACTWLVAAERAKQVNRWTAFLHGLTASAILSPLLWEATLRFHTLTPSAAASILAMFVLLGQAIAWRRDSSLLAGLVAAAGSVTAIAFIIATLNPLPFAIALAAAATFVEYGACRNRLVSMRWIAAIPADFCAFLLAYLITRPHGLPEGYAPVPVAAVIWMLWALLSVYLASILLRTLVREHRIGWFEMGQVVALAALAIETTLRIAHGPAAALAIGVGCLVAATGCYAACGIRQARQPARNSQAFAIFAILLAIIGGRLLLTGMPLATLWSAMALAATWAGERWCRNLLRVHGALYLAAAATASGLLNWSPSVASAALVGACAAISYALVFWIRPAKTLGWPERAPSVITVGLLCWSLVGLATGSAVASRFPQPITSTLRTLMISVLAIGLASIGSRWGLKELVWLLYPWMIFGAAKLILEDFGQGQPATLFVSLLFYGGTLIALPRLLRRANTASDRE